MDYFLTDRQVERLNLNLRRYPSPARTLRVQGEGGEGDRLRALWEEL